MKPMIITNINTENFDKEVAEQALPVLLDFWAPWCGQCIMLSNVIDQVAQETAGKAIVCKIDADSPGTTGLLKRFAVTKLPTMIVVKAGKEIDRICGMTTKSKLIELLIPNEKNS